MLALYTCLCKQLALSGYILGYQLHPRPRSHVPAKRGSIFKAAAEWEGPVD